MTLERNVLKTIEESIEFQNELIKYITKGKKGKFSKELLASEIADLEICIAILKRKMKISKRVKTLIPIKIAKGIKYCHKYGFRKNLNFNLLAK